MLLYKASGLGVVSPALLTLGETDGRERETWVAVSRLQQAWLGSSTAAPSLFLQTELGGLVLQGRWAPRLPWEEV